MNRQDRRVACLIVFCQCCLLIPHPSKSTLLETVSDWEFIPRQSWAEIQSCQAQQYVRSEPDRAQLLSTPYI